MLRPFHFVFLFVTLVILALFAVADEGNLPPSNARNEIESQPDTNGNNDLEADATFWGYGRPWRYYGGWGGYGGYGRGYWGGWRGGWGGRGYYGGRGWGGWGGYYG